MPRTRVLVVDDAVVVRRIVTEALGADPRIEVVGTAPNGRIALSKISHVNPDIITLDVEMPEMDGIELARRATELDPDLKVMFITGFAAVALNPDSQAPKNAKVLSKPIHLRDLVSEVERLLAA